DVPIGLRTVSLDLEQRIAQLMPLVRAGVAVVIRGEVGTGKALMARAIHESSGRAGAFVAIDCAALANHAVDRDAGARARDAIGRDAGESMHDAVGRASGDRVRDAVSRDSGDRVRDVVGRDAGDRVRDAVGRAAGGTLFLDDVADLADAAQVALLQMLADNGADAPGLVAATRDDLAMRVADGRFRSELYARLAAFELVVPPLRERREDLGTLIAALLPRLGAPERITLHRSAARAILRYGWPGNIRELEQALRAAIALAAGEIRHEHLADPIRSQAAPSLAGLRLEDRVLRDRVIELLAEHGGDVVAVSGAIGMAPVQLRRWCRRLQIELGRLRG
ncbi:MAG TPA: sigma 54-interacting transcriptional regulator, partial [Kofleriaceae bacterium]